MVSVTHWTDVYNIDERYNQLSEFLSDIEERCLASICESDLLYVQIVPYPLLASPAH